MNVQILPEFNSARKDMSIESAFQCIMVSWNEFLRSTFDFIDVKIGGRVNGALGDVRDRNGKGPVDLNRWLAKDCPAAARDQSEKNQRTIPECDSDDNVSDWILDCQMITGDCHVGWTSILRELRSSWFERRQRSTRFISTNLWSSWWISLNQPNERLNIPVELLGFPRFAVFISLHLVAC